MVNESLRALHAQLHATAAVHLVVDRVEFFRLLAGVYEARGAAVLAKGAAAASAPAAPPACTSKLRRVIDVMIGSSAIRR